MKKKQTKADKAIAAAHRLYGEPTPARITGEWLRSRIRANFGRPGASEPTAASWDALAERVNAIRTGGGVGPIRCGTDAVIAAAIATEEEIEKAIAIAEGR